MTLLVTFSLNFAGVKICPWRGPGARHPQGFDTAPTHWLFMGRFCMKNGCFLPFFRISRNVLAVPAMIPAGACGVM